MRVEGFITFVCVVLIVWGGFIYFLTRAIKYERKKKHDE